MLIKTGDLSEEDIHKWMLELRDKAYTPKSGFHVSSVFKIEVGGMNYYVGGVNIENHELGVGSCAEESAMSVIATAFADKAKITKGWVMGASKDAAESHYCTPCCECRQRLIHFAHDGATEIKMVTIDGKDPLILTVEQLAPYQFSFRDLPNNARHIYEGDLIPVNDPNEMIVKKGPLTAREIFKWANELHSDAQVAGVDKAVILKLDNGNYVAGVSIDNAAYPSSTNAAQSAVSNKYLAFEEDAKIAEIFTYERPRNKIDKEFRVLSGYSLQVLAEHCSSNAKIHVFNDEGITIKQKLPKLPSSIKSGFSSNELNVQGRA